MPTLISIRGWVRPSIRHLAYGSFGASVNGWKCIGNKIKWFLPWAIDTFWIIPFDLYCPISPWKLLVHLSLSIFPHLIFFSTSLHLLFLSIYFLDSLFSNLFKSFFFHFFFFNKTFSITCKIFDASSSTHLLHLLFNPIALFFVWENFFNSILYLSVFLFQS